MNINTKKKELLQSALLYIKEIEEAINEILNGSTVSSAVRRHNIRRSSFENIIQGKFFMNKAKTTALPLKLSDYLLSPEEKLYRYVFGGDYPLSEMPPDYSESIEKVFENIGDTLSDILRQRFFDGYTLEAIALLLGCTRESVRKMESRGIMALRKYPNSKILIYGLSKYQKVENQEKEAQRIKLETTMLATENELKSYSVEFLLLLKSKIDDILNDKNSIDYEKLDMNHIIQETLKKAVKLRPEAPISSLALHHMGFSTRLLNCLLRGGYRTLFDMENVELKSFYQIRGFGKHSMDELVHFLETSELASIVDEKIFLCIVKKEIPNQRNVYNKYDIK